MNKGKVLFLITLLTTSLAGCNSEHVHNFEGIEITQDADWQTYVVGSDFNPSGLKVSTICKDCGAFSEVEFEILDGENLSLDQESVTIKAGDYQLEYPIRVKQKYHIACVGDSLTAGHYWANESYPTMLSNIVDSKYEVKNCGVNGISVTGYGGSWDDPNMQYIKQDIYKTSIDFAPDIFAIMLGTNDATGWAKAEANFIDEYHILLDSYVEQFPNAKFIMMVSPPTNDGNQFGIPNDTIRDYVNPIQRDLADEYGFEILDLREEFEEVSDYSTRYLRPNNDGVHFTKEAAEFVAGRVWDIAKDLTF